MADNVADGYGLIGGQRMWPSQPSYWGQVVDSWANENNAVWNTFDGLVAEHGVPEAVWVMVCIFNQNDAYLEQMKKIFGLVRQRAPQAKIYVTGQPFYEPGAACSVAGDNGPQWTDDMAQVLANDESLENVEYAGKFGPLAADQKADTCHANDSGKRELGEQAAEMFGM